MAEAHQVRGVDRARTRNDVRCRSARILFAGACSGCAVGNRQSGVFFEPIRLALLT